MLNLTHSGDSGALVLMDLFTGVSVGLEEAEMCDDLRACLLAALQTDVDGAAETGDGGAAA